MVFWSTATQHTLTIELLRYRRRRRHGSLIASFLFRTWWSTRPTKKDEFSKKDIADIGPEDRVRTLYRNGLYNTADDVLCTIVFSFISSLLFSPALVCRSQQKNMCWKEPRYRRKTGRLFRILCSGAVFKTGFIISLNSTSSSSPALFFIIKCHFRSVTWLRYSTFCFFFEALYIILLFSESSMAIHHRIRRLGIFKVNDVLQLSHIFWYDWWNNSFSFREKTRNTYLRCSFQRRRKQFENWVTPLRLHIYSDPVNINKYSVISTAMSRM